MELVKSIFTGEDKFFSTTTIKADEHKIAFTWFIENFLLITDKIEYSEMNYSDASIKSAVFTTEDSNRKKYTWQLLLWPCITSVFNDDAIGLWLKCDEEMFKSNVFEADVKLSIIDSEGEATLHSMKINYRKTFSWEFSSWTTVIQRATLLEKKETLLPNNILTVRCDVNLKYNYSKKTSNTLLLKNLNISNSLNICSDLRSLFEEQKNCDVTLCMRDENFGAHKNILSIRSPVFAKMFEHDLNENKAGVIHIKDIKAPVMKILLQYIYGIEIEVPAIMYLELYFAADKYDLRELTRHCSSSLIFILDVDNVWNIAILSDAHNDSTLFSAAKTFLKKTPDALHSKAYMDFVIKSTDIANRLIE